MSDDVKHPNLDDLLDGEGTEGDDVSTDDTGTEDTEAKAEETEDDQDNLLDESLKAETAKQEIVKGWANKISLGKATLDDLKEKQAWLVPDVEKLIKKDSAKVDPDELKKLAQEAAREILEKEKSERQGEEVVKNFDTLKKQILDSNPTFEQKKILKEKFDSLQGKLDPHEALSLAAEVAQIDLDGTMRRRANLVIPRPSSQRTTSPKLDFDRINPNAQSADQLRAFVEAESKRR